MAGLGGFSDRLDSVASAADSDNLSVIEQAARASELQLTEKARPGKRSAAVEFITRASADARIKRIPLR